MLRRQCDIQSTTKLVYSVISEVSSRSPSLKRGFLFETQQLCTSLAVRLQFFAQITPTKLRVAIDGPSTISASRAQTGDSGRTIVNIVKTLGGNYC